MHAADLSATRDEASPQLQAHAWPLALRILGAVGQLLAAANLFYLVARTLRGLLGGEQPVPMEIIAGWLALYSLVPVLVVRLMRYLATATVQVEATQLVLTLRGTRFEIPFTAVAELRPWRVPLPGPGFTLRMKSGRSFQYGLEAADPAPLLAAIGRASDLGAAAAIHPSTRYASARAALMRRRWYHLALKYGLFSLLPTGILFRLDQYITYGGLFGEYYLLGLKAYLRTFATWWIQVVTALVLYAAVWRAAAELAVIAATWLAPSRSRGARRAAEILCRIVYYAGVPALIAARILM